MLNAKGKNAAGKVRPSVMAFSRQGMPNLPGTSKEGVLKGGYIVHGGDAKPDVIFLATGARPFWNPLSGSCALYSCQGFCYCHDPGWLLLCRMMIDPRRWIHSRV